jgi:N-glycosylase/DNA lyase
MKRARAVAQQVLCRASELSPATLTSGQAFRWAQHENEGVWRSPLGSVVFSLSWTEDEQVVFAVDPPGVMSEDEARAKLRDYFRLDCDLATMTREWQARDPQFVATPGAAVRQLRQEPFECLMSFICSQNNNVKRIGAMIEKLCTALGSPVGGKFTFPTLAQLARATEEQLRELGFGYRAPYIVDCVRHLQEKPEGFLLSLREKPLEECRNELTALNGVGLKVADCVALFSLDKTEVVPVDTHVWQIARDKLSKYL